MTSTGTHTILVVEDERPLLDAIRLKFEKNNIEVVTARSMEQAMAYITDGVKIDAIWLDHYLLGRATGLDFVAKLKGNEKYRSIPVFVVSNSSTHDKQQTYLRLGVNKYYVKADHRLDELIKEVKQYIEDPED
jgi:CheY-like chemotaxis protein